MIISEDKLNIACKKTETFDFVDVLFDKIGEKISTQKSNIKNWISKFGLWSE